MPTGHSATHNQGNYWNAENSSHQPSHNNAAAYWSYMQQFSAPQQNQPQQFVESPWNQVGWGYLPAQTQHQDHYQQQQQQQQQQPQQPQQQQNYENYQHQQWNAYQNQIHQQQMGYNNYPVQSESFTSNVHQSTANNNYETHNQYQNVGYIPNIQSANAVESQPVQYYNQLESNQVQSSAFTPVYQKSAFVENSQNYVAEDAFVQNQKQQTPEPIQNSVEQEQSSSSTIQKAGSQPPPQQHDNAPSNDNQWGSWGDEGDLDLDDSTVAAFYSRDDDVDYSQLNEQQDGNETHPVSNRAHGAAAPDLVATSQSAPDNQAAAERECQDPDKQQRKPPDLFSGHEHNSHRNGPDVVSVYDAAQADVLEDVCLDPPVVEEFEHNHNYKSTSLAQVMTKWGQKLVNNLAPEADKEPDDQIPSQNLNSEAATLSLAGIVHQQHQSAAQPRSRSSSTVSATSPKLGFSELLTYSYYEAEVKRPTVEENEEIVEQSKSSNDVVVTASEVSVSAEEQLPEADLAQLEQKWNCSAVTSTLPQMDLTEDESISSPVTVLDATPAKSDVIHKNHTNAFGDDHENVPKNDSTLPKNYSAAAEDEENWSMVENYDDRSKADLPSASITYNNSLSSWNQWEDEEEGRESPENLETRGVANSQAMSDWRPESERDEPAASTVQQNVQDECVDVEEWLHCQRDGEGSDVVVELLSHSKEFEITVNEPVNVAPAPPIDNDNLHPIAAHQQPITGDVPAVSDPKLDLDSGIDDRRENASMWSAVSNIDEKSVREMPADDTESTTENKAFPAESCGSSSQPSPHPESHHTESVVDPLLIDRFLQDTNQMANANVRKPPTLRRDDSSIWSTMANPETDSVIAPIIKVSPSKDNNTRLPSNRKKVESISSQGSSAISLSRKPTQNFNALSKDPDALQTDSLAKKRRESLHKRYKEATKKSKEIFARLNVSLLSTTLESSVIGRQTPLLIVPSISEASSNVPTPEPSPATLFSKSIKAKSTPVQNEVQQKGEQSERRRENEHERRRPNERERRRGDEDDDDDDDDKPRRDEPPSRDKESERVLPERRRSSDLENRRDSYSGRNFDTEHKRRYGRRPNSRASEQADWRHHSFNDDDDENDGSWRNRRRPYSRASERDDWSRYQRAEDFRHRPHSTQGFDSEEDSGEYEDEEVKEYYRKWRQYQNYPYAGQRVQQYGWGLPQSRSLYSQQQAPAMDPGWQKYLTDFYKLNGYYPTYEQLHRMWTEQHATAAKIPQQKPLKVRVPKLGTVEKIIEPTTVALKRTEEYVADQRQQLFSDEKESEPSVSRADSERSFDVPSSVSVVETYQVQVPFKHSVAHAVCRFGVGGHLTIVSGGNRASGQRQTVVEIRHVRNVIKNDAEIEENLDKMDSFPGPLSPLSSDKSALIQFCQRKAEKYRHDLTVMDRDSAVLVWNLLICLIRQNGAIVGSDLSRLLMDGREISDSTNVVEVEKHSPPRRHSRDDDDYEEISAYERSFISSATQTTDRVEQHFRELLLGGTKKEALEWAIKYKLWGHALFLAMKIDQRTHTNVMIRFANSLALNDPLQTLYQMMSGVMPYASTQLPDDKWGDWRPHLAIILSNISLLNGVAVDGQAFEREMMSVLTLGNTLMDDGRTFAAQFCYLCCHLLSGWDVFSVQQRRQYISLIGAHCDLKDDEIFTLDRVQMTEIYEYAVGLMYAQAKQTFCLPTIQIYKLRYVLHLAELGFAEDAYKYCLVLSSAIQQMPNLFSYSLVSLVVDLGTKLQRFDSSNEHINFGYQSNQTFPQWILDLNMIAHGLKDGTIGSIQPRGQQQQQEIISNQHLSSYQTNAAAEDNQKHFYVGQPEDQPTNNNNTNLPLVVDSIHVSPKIDSRRSSMQISNASREISFGRDSVEPPDHGRKMSAVSTPRHSVGRDRLDSIEDHVEPIAAPTSYYPVDNRERDRTYAEVASPPIVTVDEHRASMNQSFNSNFGISKNQNETDYYDRISSTNTPAFSDTPINKSQTRGFNSISTDGAGVNDNVFTPSPRQNDVKPANENLSQQRLKPEQKIEPTKRNKSWITKNFEKVVTKLLPSPNQMILPDDKQKSIVWDEKMQRWMNVNGDDVDDTPPPPPPSLASSAANIMPGSGHFQSVAQQDLVGAVNAALPDQPAVVKPVNRFASQKRYATINGLGGAASTATATTAPGNLPPLSLPTVGAVTAPQKHYFVPQAMDSNSNEEYTSSDPFSTVENNQQGTGVNQ